MGGSKESETKIVWDMREIPDLSFAGDPLRNHEERTSELSHLGKKKLGICPLTPAPYQL